MLKRHSVNNSALLMVVGALSRRLASALARAPIDVPWRLHAVHAPPPLLLLPSRAAATHRAAAGRASASSERAGARAAGPRTGVAALELSELRLVGGEGSIGVMPPSRALALADEQGLVLTEVAPSASPPVWKLLPPMASAGKAPAPAASVAAARAGRPPDVRTAHDAQPEQSAVRYRRPPKPGKQGETQIKQMLSLTRARSRPLFHPTPAQARA